MASPQCAIKITTEQRPHKNYTLGRLMTYSDIPNALLCGPATYLVPPTLERAQEMHTLILGFTQTHLKHLSWANENISLHDTYTNMKIALENFNTDNIEYKFLIIHSTSHKLLGCVSLFIHDLRIPYLEIGYWIGSDSMGKGYASEACALVRDIAVKFFNANRIELTTARRNTRSIRVAERCGFTCEAVLSNARIDDTGLMDDTCIYVFTGALAK